jgi:hypothetical protein
MMNKAVNAIMKLNLTKGEFYIISLFAMLINGCDLLTTFIGLRLGAVEINSLFSLTSFYLGYKILSITLFIILINVLFNKVKKLKLACQTMLLITTFIFTYIVINNLIVILKCL